jgi:hypothetical protein
MTGYQTWMHLLFMTLQLDALTASAKASGVWAAPKILPTMDQPTF